jgi:hypothetical protein
MLSQKEKAAEKANAKKEAKCAKPQSRALTFSVISIVSPWFFWCLMEWLCIEWQGCPRGFRDNPRPSWSVNCCFLQTSHLQYLFCLSTCTPGVHDVSELALRTGERTQLHLNMPSQRVPPPFLWQEIDDCLVQAKDRSYDALVHFGKRGLNVAATAAVMAASKVLCQAPTTTVPPVLPAWQPCSSPRIS